jgi:ribosomal protein S27AE
MTKAKHVHKLQRYKYSTGNIIYRCVLPDCNFKSVPALVLGKRSLCNRCGEEFILSEYSIRLAKPHCSNCHKPKNQYDLQDLVKDTVSVDNPPESLSERLSRAIHSKPLSPVIEEEEI